MIREEAITELLWHMDCYDDKAEIALGMAIAALREQEERSEGCEFCLNGEHLTSHYWDKYGDEIPVKFCPMCGRNLVKE